METSDKSLITVTLGHKEVATLLSMARMRRNQLLDEYQTFLEDADGASSYNWDRWVKDKNSKQAEVEFWQKMVNSLEEAQWK